MNARPLVLWMIWGGILVGYAVTYVVLGHVASFPSPAGVDPRLALAGIAPLAASAVIRWLVLPRAGEPGARLALFFVGLALAESCGILGAILGGPVYRDPLAALALLGIVQFVPVGAADL